MGVLKIKVGGVWYSILRGPKGDKGDPGDSASASITPKAASIGPGSYPDGLSYFKVNDATWPEANGIVVTQLSSGAGNQTFWAVGGQMYRRSQATASTWTSWFIPGNITRVVWNGTAWPARPTGAQMVEWVGPAAQRDTAPSANGDNYMATDG